MELKVWVEGIQRIVCGVSESTTCQDVVYALAHATGKTGRFTLMERWRNNERLLAPHEHPLKILLKWGEYASDVQFILQRTALEPKADNRTDSKTTHGSLSSNQRTSQPLPGGPQRITQKGSSSTLDPSQKSTLQSSFQNRDIKKSLTFSGGHTSHLPISTEGVTSVQGSEVGSFQSSQGYISRVSPVTQHPHPYPSVHQESSSGHQRPLYPPSSSSARPMFSINRPPAPPPYELVRGHPPPPPPPTGSSNPRHQLHTQNTYAVYPQDKQQHQQQKDWRNTLQHPQPPPPHPSVVRPSPQPFQPLFRAPQHPSNPGHSRPLRELPPYRDPPPPPPPSHPALKKISPKTNSHSPPNSSSDCASSKLFDKEKKPFSGNNKVADGVGGESSGVTQEERERLERVHNVTFGNRSSSSDLVAKSGSQVAVSTKSRDKLKKEDSRTKEELTSDRSLNSSGEWPDKAKSSRSSSPVKSMHADSNKNASQTTTLNNNLSEIPKNHEGEDKNAVVQNIIKQLVKNSAKEINSIGNNSNHNTEEVIVDGYYRELVKLVNQQREKISAQQVDLTKFDEIAFAEGRRKEEESRLTYLQDEIQRLEKTSEKNVDLRNYKSIKLKNHLERKYIEEQLRSAKKAETTSKDEISELQKKISSCDQKLGQMNTRVRSIEEALRHEELAQQQKAQEAFQEEEQEALLREIEKLQLAVDQATTQADHTQEISQELAQEMQESESRLEEKRKEIESLKQAMREANLEALSMTPPDEAKTLSESRSGTAKCWNKFVM
ncbi:Ras association domain-containing protein 8 [Armadillidium vulgare]|nr:Ras association domain-containing protein 8 [Armadillidium vulgare]